MKAWRCETSRVAGVPDGFKGMEVMKLESTRGPLNVSLELDASAGGTRSHGLLSRGELGLLLLICVLPRLGVWVLLSLRGQGWGTPGPVP